MLYATAIQGREFFAMALCGMLMAGISLGFALLRRLMAAGKGLSLICDGLMGVIWAALFCGFLMGASGGRCRGYHLLATALGAALARGALAVPGRRLICRIRGGFRAIGRRLGKTRLCKILTR